MAPFKKKAETRLAEARAALADTSPANWRARSPAERCLARRRRSHGGQALRRARNAPRPGTRSCRQGRTARGRGRARGSRGHREAPRRCGRAIREEACRWPTPRPTSCRTTMAKAEKLFRRDHRRCGPMPGPHGLLATCTPTPLRAPPRAQRYRAPPSNGCFPGTSIRIGARPFLGGRPGEIVEETFPGAVCPRNEVRGRPLDITPFADALRAASKFAVDMMKGKLDPLAALPPAGNGTSSIRMRLHHLARCAAISRNALRRLLKEQAQVG